LLCNSVMHYPYLRYLWRGHQVEVYVICIKEHKICIYYYFWSTWYTCGAKAVEQESISTYNKELVGVYGLIFIVNFQDKIICSRMLPFRNAGGGVVFLIVPSLLNIKKNQGRNLKLEYCHFSKPVHLWRLTYHTRRYNCHSYRRISIWNILFCTVLQICQQTTVVCNPTAGFSPALNATCDPNNQQCSGNNFGAIWTYTHKL
jgi:hypothetical protein